MAITPLNGGLSALGQRSVEHIRRLLTHCAPIHSPSALHPLKALSTHSVFTHRKRRRGSPVHNKRQISTGPSHAVGVQNGRTSRPRTPEVETRTLDVRSGSLWLLGHSVGPRKVRELHGLTRAGSWVPDPHWGCRERTASVQPRARRSQGASGVGSLVREARRGRVAAKTGRVSALSSRGQRQICRRNAAAAGLITRLGAPQLRRAAFDGVPDWAGVARGERGRRW